MFSCADFLREFSEYRDGRMTPAERSAVEAHLGECDACARYAEVMEAGVEQLRALPPLEPSYDFLSRLQHRIYHLEDERAAIGSRSASGASAGFVVAAAAVIALAAALPLIRSQPAVLELPPVAASAPQAREAVPALFRDGPLLIDDRSLSVYLRYSRLGSPVSYQLGGPGFR
jgi:anti-sigma factor RsiW